MNNELEVGEASFAFDFNDALTLKAGVASKTYNLDTTAAVMASEGNNGVTTAQPASLLYTYDAGALGSWAAPNLDAFNQQYGFYADSGVFTDDHHVYSRAPEFVSPSRRRPTAPSCSSTSRSATPCPFAVTSACGRSRRISTLPVSQASLPARSSPNVQYSDTLPSLNLVAELTDELLLRFGYAEVISRPGMLLLRPVASVSVAGSNRTVNGNNPGLGPTLADTYDLSAEWYFAEESVLALALFRKDIGSFIQTIVRNVPYTETGCRYSKR